MVEKSSSPFPQVAVNIRAARTAAGLTQEQLARELDIALRTVSAWENGERLPQGRNLAALSLALGRHASWIFAEHAHGREVAA